jgi:hypothetical protein
LLLHLGSVPGQALADDLDRGELSSIRLKPRAATLRTDGALPAAIQIGGCGRCLVGGSTTMSSNCQ